MNSSHCICGGGTELLRTKYCLSHQITHQPRLLPNSFPTAALKLDPSNNPHLKKYKMYGAAIMDSHHA